MLNSRRKTFLFRSRLPQTNVQSPYADPTRSKINLPVDEFITIKDLKENVVSDLSNQSIESFIKSTISAQKFSPDVNNKKRS
ncbi:ATP-dependent helicase/nuclease subunit [Dirofilaria immitis]